MPAARKPDREKKLGALCAIAVWMWIASPLWHLTQELGPPAQRIHHVTRARLCILLLLAAFAASAGVADQQEPAVKLSQSGICHERGTSSYGATLHYQSFDSLPDCLKAGGRSVKAKHGQTSNGQSHDRGPSWDDWRKRLNASAGQYTAGIVVTVLLVTAVMWWRRRRTRNGGRGPMSSSTGSAPNDLAERTQGAVLLNSILGAPSRSAEPRSKGGASAGWSATKVLDATQHLQAMNAQWPAIIAELNPKSDRAIQQLLLEIRGPHMFAPNVALNAIADGARRALAANPRASARDALRESLRTINTIVWGGAE
jgi:hypothetical protein